MLSATDEAVENDLSSPDGEEEEQHASVRRCLVSGDRKPKEALVRFVVGPDNRVVPDVAEKLPGRGMWLSADARSFKTAVEKKAFHRAARRAVDVPDGLAVQVEGLLARRCVDALSLARRAGEAVCGFEKVKALLKSGQGAVLLTASDASADGREKLAALATALGGVRPVGVLASDELARAFGRDRVVHAAVAKGGLGERLAQDAARLEGFRDGGGMAGPGLDSQDSSAGKDD